MFIFFKSFFSSKVFRDTGIYTIGAIFQKGISFLLIPLYISVLNPAEYGSIDFAVTLLAVISIIFNFGIPEVIFTEYYHKNELERIFTIRQAFLAYFTISLPLYFLILFILLFADRILLGIHYESICMVIMIISGFFSFFPTVFSSLLKLKGDSLFLTTFSIISGLLSAITSIILVYYLRLGIFGFFLSNLIISLLSFIFIFNYFFKTGYLSSSFSKPEITRIIKLGYPFIFSGLAYWFLNGIDRWLIIRMLGENELGLYSLASKFAFTLQPLLIMPILNSIIQPLFKRFSENKYYMYYKGIFVCTIIVFTLLGFGITYISGFIIKEQNYFKAIPLISIFVLGTGFNFLSQYTANVLLFHQKIKKLIYNIIFAGLFNIILNIILITKYDIKGAAFAYLLSNIFWALLTYIQSQIFIKRLNGQII